MLEVTVKFMDTASTKVITAGYSHCKQNLTVIITGYSIDLFHTFAMADADLRYGGFSPLLTHQSELTRLQFIRTRQLDLLVGELTFRGGELASRRVEDKPQKVGWLYRTL